MLDGSGRCLKLNVCHLLQRDRCTCGIVDINIVKRIQGRKFFLRCIHYNIIIVALFIGVLSEFHTTNGKAYCFIDVRGEDTQAARLSRVDVQLDVAFQQVHIVPHINSTINTVQQLFSLAGQGFQGIEIIAHDADGDGCFDGWSLFKVFHFNLGAGHMPELFTQFED